MRDCTRWEEQVERYHDGELRRSARLDVEKHLEGCDGCQAYLESLESLGGVVGLPVEEALERVDFGDLWNRISAEIEDEPAPSWIERLVAWFQAFWEGNGRVVLAGAVASCLTLLVAIPLMSDRDSPSGVGSEPEIAVNEVIVDSLQSGEHDMVLVNVHPEDMTTVIWLLEDEDEDEQETPLGAEPDSVEPTDETGELDIQPPSAAAGVEDAE